MEHYTNVPEYTIHSQYKWHFLCSEYALPSLGTPMDKTALQPNAIQN